MYFIFLCAQIHTGGSLTQVSEVMAKNVFSEVTMTFDHQNVISSSLSPSEEEWDDLKI